MSRVSLFALTGAFLGVALLGCGGGDTQETGDTTSSSSSSSSTSEVTGHSLGMDVTLKAGADGKLAFLTPSNTIVAYEAAEIAGKPTLIATFPAGFSPGNDPPIEYLWGTMPDDLMVHFTSSEKYEDGPYDIVFVCYRGTPISQDMMDGVTGAPAAANGDLASFTLSAENILDGDPKNALGTLRLNVAGADASVAIENRTPDPNDPSTGATAFNDTVLTIP